MHDGSAAGAGLPGRVHHQVVVAVIGNHDNQLIFRILQFCLLLLYICLPGEKIAERLSAAHAADRDDERDARAGNVDI